MSKREPDLLLFHAPLLRQGMTTPGAMRDVLYALAPATAASFWFFGISAAATDVRNKTVNTAKLVVTSSNPRLH